MGLLDSIKSAFSSTGAVRIDIGSRFVRERTAATGTMAHFFVAKDLKHDNRTVGVKVLDIEKVKLFEGRFKGLGKPTEGEIAMRMQHPKVVKTYEHGISTKGEPILIMEYISGASMQNIIVNKQGDLIEGRRIKLIRDMAEALQYVHSQEFIHRDICPRNFICLPNCEGAKLIDFGLTVPALPPFMAPGNRTGTPLYMSPEIVRRRPTDKRVDIFSFGVTCYCLCSFAHPWQGEIVSGRAALHHDTKAPKPLSEIVPNIDPKLSRAIMSALEPKVEERTESIDLFLSAIRSVESAYVDS